MVCIPAFVGSVSSQRKTVTGWLVEITSTHTSSVYGLSPASSNGLGLRMT